MKQLIWITGIAILLIAGTVYSQTQTPVHLVQVNISTPGTLESLHEMNLDIPGPPTPDGWLQVIVTDEEMEMLVRLGYRVEEIIHHMQQYYADRLGARPMGDYMTFDEIVAALDTIHANYPNITTEKFSIGQSLEGRDIWAIKLSDNPNIDEEEPELFWHGTIHAREVITYTMLIYTMERLTENYGVDTMITRLIDSNELFIVPVANPDGLVYNEITAPSGGGMWRKNRRDNGDGSFGIDLNRNFDFYWGYNNIGSDPNPSDICYRGPFPFSEPETQVLRDFCISRQFCIIVDNHAYSNVHMYPWGPLDFGLTPDSLEFMEIGAAMASQTGYPYGTCYQTINYEVNGCSFDWYYGEQTTKVKSFAVSTEIGSSYEGFWPPASSIQPLCHENYLAKLQLLDMAHLYCPDSTDLRYVSNIIDDAGGNGNGIPDPGETINMDVTLKNFGMHTTTGITGILTESDPYVSIGVTIASFDNMGPNQEGTSQTPFQFTVDSSCPILHEIQFQLQVSTATGYSTSLDFSVIVGQREEYYSIDFETGALGWTHHAASGWNDEWHLSTARSQSPTHSWKCGDTGSGDYTNHMDARLVSPVLPLQNHAQLKFWHWMESEISGAYPDSAYDAGIVEVSVDGGAWALIEPDGDYPKTTRTTSGGGSPYSGPFAGIPCYAGNFNWQEAAFDLGSLTGDSLQIRFRFGSDNSAADEGWYVDDVSLWGVLPVSVVPVTNFVITRAGNNIILTWTGGGSPDGYRVYRSLTPDGTFIQIWQGTSTNYIDIDALDRTINFYYVTSYTN